MDFQLIAIAAVINIVVFILCYLYYGSRRERSFEDALAEMEGLNILLSDKDHDQHGKKHQKDLKKKKQTTKKTATKRGSGAGLKHDDERGAVRKDSNASSEAAPPSTNASKEEMVNAGSGTMDEEKAEEYQLMSAQPLDDSKAAQEEAVVVAAGEAVHKKRAKKHSKKEKPNRKSGGVSADEGSTGHRDASNERHVTQDVVVDQQFEKTPKNALNEKQSNVEDDLSSEVDDSHHPQDPLTLLAVEESLQSAPSLPSENSISPDSAPKKKKTKTKSGAKRATANDAKSKNDLFSPSDNFDKIDGPQNFEDAILVKSVHQNQYSSPPSQFFDETQPEIYASIAKFKKQLDEKDIELAQEKQKLNVALQSLKELNQEVINEKQRFSMMEANFKEQLTIKQNENQNLSQKMHEFQNQMASKMQAYRQMETQVLQYRIESGNAAQAQQLREDNQRLKDRITSIEQEMHARNTDLQRLKQELISRDTQVHRLEQQRQEMEQRRVIQDASFTQQLMDSQNKCLQKEKECVQLVEELKATKKDCSLLDQDAKVLRLKLTEKENHVQTLCQNAAENESKKMADANLTQQLVENQNKLMQKEKECAQLIDELKVLQKEVSLLQQDHKTLRQKLADTSKKQQDANFTQQLAESQSKLTQKEKECVQLTDEMKLIRKEYVMVEQEHKMVRQQLMEKEQHLQNLQNHMQSLENQVHTYSHQNSVDNDNIKGVIIDPEVLKVNERSMAQLNKQLINKDVEIAHLKEQLEILRQKNIDLREKKYKAVDSVQQMEKNVKEVIDRNELKCKKELADLEKEIRESLSRVLPNFRAPSEKVFKQWLSDYEKAVKCAVTQASSVQPVSNVKVVKPVADTDEISRKKIEELTIENKNLQHNLECCRHTLLKIDSRMANLGQSFVNTSDNQLREKCSTLEEQLKELKLKTCNCLKEQLKSSEQVQSQLYSFKTLLEHEKNERETLLKELRERSEQLNNERAVARDLSVQTVKLRGMLKTGQDALKHEQELVGHLQNQLKTLQESKGGLGVHEEIQEIRKKMQQREQQLEKEMAINKQLNDKLASLGVTTPFVSVS